METQAEILDFVKAISNVERLRIIGALTRGPATISQVAERLSMSFRDIMNHMEFLAYVGVVHAQPAARKQDEFFELDSSGLEKLSHAQFSNKREIYVPAPDLDEKARKVLASHLNVDGSIRQIPAQLVKFQIILDYIVAAFTPGVNYTEKEVNTIILRFHTDTATLRRGLIDSGKLARESNGSRYWRPEHVEGRSV